MYITKAGLFLQLISHRKCSHKNNPIYPVPTPTEPTLRDKFAMAALTGILAGSPNKEIGPEDYAHDAYMFADAMIEAREAK